MPSRGDEFEFDEAGHLTGRMDEFVPRKVLALAGKNGIGAASGYHHTVVWTEVGELYTFGLGNRWQGN